MYYNRFTGKIEAELFDFFLIGCWIGIKLISAQQKQKQMSEKASAERLKNSIIEKSPLKKTSKASKVKNFMRHHSSKVFNKIRIRTAANPTKALTAYYSKVLKVLDVRGGQDFQDFLARQAEFEEILRNDFLRYGGQAAKLIKIYFLTVLSFLSDKIQNEDIKKAFVRMLVYQAIGYLKYMLAINNIHLEFLNINGPGNPRYIPVLTCLAGTMVGAIWAWISSAACVTGPPLIAATFIGRSIFKQFMHNLEFERVMALVRDASKQGKKLLEDQNEIQNLMSAINKKKDECYARNIKFQDERLKLKENPAVQEAVERLGIFENAPKTPENISLNTLDPDPDLKKLLGDSGPKKGVGESSLFKRRQALKLKPRIQSKTVYFSDLNQSEILDAEIITDKIPDPKFIIDKFKKD